MIEVFQEEEELAAVVEVYKRRNPKRVLEIGVWDGGTLREWLRNSSPEVVVAIDTEHRNEAEYGNWRADGKQLILGRGRSQDRELVLRMSAYAPYDWAFIDGDHTYDGVKQDVENVLPLMAPGGILAMHDVIVPPGSLDEDGYGTVRVFAGLAETYDTEVIQSDPPFPRGHGIGLVFIR